MLYLDNASTTRVNPEVLTTYQSLLAKYFANADSIYDLGVEVHNLQEKSRNMLAKLLKVNSSELTFCSCASEANNLAIKGYAFANQHHGKHLICSAIEHSSVIEVFKQLEAHFGFSLTILPVNHQGVVEVETLRKAMRKDTILVAIMYVNNEVGSIQPINELAKVVHQEHYCAFLVDCVQALGKIDLDLTNVDLASFSAHKVNGLKGSGLLYHRLNKRLMPLVIGGQQESGLRAGTSNYVLNIVLAKTFRLALEKQQANQSRIHELKTYLYNELSSMPEISLNSDLNGSDYICSFSVLTSGSEIMMNALSKRGVYVSAKSTCSTSKKSYSPVLEAMGKDSKSLNGVLRVSFTYDTTLLEVQEFIKTLKEIIYAYSTN